VAENSVQVELNLDTRNFKKSLDKIEVESANKAKNTSEKFTKEFSTISSESVKTLRKFNKDVESSITKSNTQIKNSFNVLEKTSKSFYSGGQSLKMVETNRLIETSFIDVGSTISKTNQSLFENQMQTENASNANKLLAVGVLGVSTRFIDYAQILNKANVALIKNHSGLKQFESFTRTMGRSTLDLSKNFFGFVEMIGITGIALASLGAIARQSDDSLVRMAGTVSLIVGAALSGFSALIVVAVTKLGSFLYEVGTNGVRAFQAFSKSFESFEKANLIFTRTVESFNKVYGEQIGNLEAWESRIESISKATGLSRTELRKTVAELVAAGAQFNLTEKEISKLLDVTVDYSTVTGNLFNTAIDFIGALNGSSQSVIKYGVKLNESTVEQYALNAGVKRSISSLNDEEKMYLRLGKVLSIHNVIQGKAVAVSNTLAGQQQKLASTIENVNEQIGRGASIIENYNVVALVVNTALSGLNDSFLTLFGFLGALASRLVQIFGLFLKWSFLIFGVVKAFKILDIALKTDFMRSALAKSIPLLNMSFIQLTASTGAATVNFKSAAGLFATAGSVLVATLKQVLSLVSGVEMAKLSLWTVVRGLATKGFGFVTIAVKALGTALLVLVKNPFFLGITAITAALIGLYKTFRLLENQTGIISSLWGALKDVFAGGASIFAPFIGWLDKVRSKVVTLAATIAGFLVDKIAGAFQFIAAIIQKNPLGLFSASAIESVTAADQRLQMLRATLQNYDLDIRKLADLNRSIASESGFELPESLFRSDEIAQTTSALGELNNRIYTLAETQKSFFEVNNDLMNQYKNNLLTVTNEGADGFQEMAKRVVENNEEIVKSTQATFVHGMGNAFAAFGQALATGENGLAAFGKSILSAFGDILIQLGTQVLATGLGMAAVPVLFGPQGPAAIVAGGIMIAAGGALKGLAGAGASGGAAAPSPQLGGSTPPIAGDLDNPGDIVASVEPERAEPDTNVTINISGVVTDPRGTAKQIGELLKDGFKTNGLNIARATV
jgi:hypothetical protein